VKPLSSENSFDAQLTENCIAILKRGKAVDLDHLSAEHFHFCYPLLPKVLFKLFNYDFSCKVMPLLVFEECEPERIQSHA
jgi:hypothetical protein